MRRWPRSVLGPAALVVSVLAAACGGSTGTGTPAVASAGDGTTRNASDKEAEVDREKAGLDFARCMREHGVDMPDPESDGGFVRIGPGPGAAGSVEIGSGPPAGFEEADAACRHFLDDLIQDGGGPLGPEEQDKALKFAKCMREHGVDMPDPDFGNGRVEIRIGGNGVQPGSDVLEAAHKACGGLFGPGDGPRVGSSVRPRS